MARSNNQIMVSEAREAMNRFKMEAANEMGVNLKDGYNGDITARQAGSIGGQMVKNVTPIRSTSFRRRDRTAEGHAVVVTYIASITL